ncbi:MAG TPA: hypothetical protein VE090_02180 [Methylomirabilota bacterium]|nr:hypothetical protein [Methylomirabilota bacterium]
MDKAVEKTELVIKALEYAHTNKLDINKTEDVKKILEIFDPAHISEAEVDEFMNLLQNADTFMDMTARQKTEKSDLPN